MELRCAPATASVQGEPGTKSLCREGERGWAARLRAWLGGAGSVPAAAREAGLDAARGRGWLAAARGARLGAARG